MLRPQRISYTGLGIAFCFIERVDLVGVSNAKTLINNGFKSRNYLLDIPIYLGKLLDHHEIRHFIFEIIQDHVYRLCRADKREL
jgi:hypothetical protein